MAHIIGLCGPQRAGKSTLAKALTEQIKNSAVLSLATHLRDIGQVLVGEPVVKEKFYTELGLTGRQILQRIGTEVGRNLSDRIWINNLLNRAQEYDVVIVDDVRFLNEADVCDALAWVQDADAEPVQDSHASEADQDALWERANVHVTRRGDVYFNGCSCCSPRSLAQGLLECQR